MRRINEVDKIWNKVDSEKLENLECEQGWYWQGSVEHYKSQIKSLINEDVDTDKIIDEIQENVDDAFKRYTALITVKDLVEIGSEITLCELTNVLAKLAYDPLDHIDEDTLLENGSVGVDLDGYTINVCFNITTKCECLLDTILEVTEIEEI